MNSRVSFALGFLALIVVGAIALSSPWARLDGVWGGWGESLFMACSAVCVTGLSLVDLAAVYSRTGQIILLALVELGCLGLMTCGTFFLVAIGRRLSLSREFSLMNAYGMPQVQGVKGLILWTVGSMLTLEILGAAVLNSQFHDLYLSFFFAIMGFCNAGFSLYPDSLASFVDKPIIILTMALLTILGGIGFLVIYNLCTFKFIRSRTGARAHLSLHTRVVLRLTGVLLLVSLAAFLLLEWNGSLASFPWLQKLEVAFYQAVTPRTCGFTIVPTESLRPLTRLIYEVLMFIGGAPGSAAAGIKVTTFAVLVATLRAMCRGDVETIIARRAIPADIVRESIVIMMAVLAFVICVTGALFATEPVEAIRPDALFFEAVSAVTTTGLSVGDTTRLLTPAGRVIIMCAMFIGRLGALTVVMMIGDRESSHLLRYPSEELVVG